MKNNKILLCIILFFLTLLGQYLFFQSYNLLHNFKNGKPTIVIRVISARNNFKLEYLPMLNCIIKEKYNVVMAQNGMSYDLVIKEGGCRSYERLNKKAIKIYYTFEAILPINFSDFDLVIGFNNIKYPNYIRIPYYYMAFSKDISFNYNRGVCNPNKKNFACFMFSNAYKINPYNSLPFDGVAKRNSLFDLLSKYKHVISAGRYLNNIDGPWQAAAHDFYKINECKFVIAYENQSYDGYITEKPFSAYLGGAIPIYYADRSVISDINTNAVIFAPDFTDENSLVEYIKKVDNDDELYCKIWNEKLLKSPDQDYEVVKAALEARLEKIFEEKLNNKK